jgi:hypothetical protein
LLVEVVRGADGVERGPNFIHTARLSAHDPFVLKLRIDLSAEEESAGRPKQLQVGHLYHEATRAWENGEFLGRNLSHTTSIPLCRRMEKYLKGTLKVWVADSAWFTLARLSRFRGAFASDTEFEAFLQDLRNRALVTWPGFRPVYANLAPPGPAAPSE